MLKPRDLPSLFDVPPIQRVPSRHGSTAHLPELVIKALDDVFDAVPVGDCLTAEMVRERISYDMRCLLALPIYRAGLGGYFSRKRKAGRIKAEGFTTAQRNNARGRPIRRWRKCA